MRKWNHRLKNINKLKKIGDCALCGVGVKLVNCRPDQTPRCHFGRKVGSRPIKGSKSNLRYRIYFILSKNRTCFECAITNEDIRFFDVHHKDGNHKNNNIDNLVLLCPNCHRTETIYLWNKLSNII